MVQMPIGVHKMGVHIGATWQIGLNPPSALVMQPYIKLLYVLVITFSSGVRDFQCCC